MESVKDLSATVRLQRTEDSSQCIRENVKPDLAATNNTTNTSNVSRRDKTTVLITSSILGVEVVDAVKQEFTCEFWFSAVWKEPSLKGKQAEDIEWKEEWNPKVYLRNAVKIEDIQKDQHMFCEEDEDIPYLQENCKVRGTFKAAMDSSGFPFDCQLLIIELTSAWKNTVVQFEKDMRAKDIIQPQALTANHEWQLIPHVITESCSLGMEDSGPFGKKSYPSFNMLFLVKRKSVLYFWFFGLLMLIVAALAFTAFAVPSDQTANRLIIVFILLLIVVALKSRVHAKSTTTGRMSLLDKYSLSCIAFIMGIAIESALAGIFSSETKRDLFDKVCLYFAFAFFFVMQMTASLYSTLRIFDNNRVIKNFENLYKVTANEVERLRRERAWYAEKRQQSKSVQSLNRSLASSQDGIERNISPSAPILPEKSYV